MPQSLMPQSPQKGPNLISIVPRLAVTATRGGSPAPTAARSASNIPDAFHAWAVQAGTELLILESTGLLTVPQGTTYSLSGAGFQFDAEVVATPSASNVTNPITLRLSSPAQRPAFDALIGSQRKVHHIEICEQRDVESSDRNHGLAPYSFMPCALPELAWDELDTRVKFLDRTFDAPILITGMTGGVERGRDINHNLARAAAAARIPMGVGSQRLALDDERFADVFNVKKEVPDVFLIGNIGAAQLVGGRSQKAARELCLRAVSMISADALAIHVNVLQEMIQMEGDRDFRKVLDCIAYITKDFPVPVVVKEVGAGMDPRTAVRLVDAGVKVIDVGGRGGTSWGWIEGLRAADPLTLDLAQSFRDWGLTTGMALAMTRQAIPPTIDCQLIATGGIRTGVDVAKVVALGATMAGVGLPLFRAALKSTNDVATTLDQLIKGLKTVMMCTGTRELPGLAEALFHNDSHQHKKREPLP